VGIGFQRFDELRRIGRNLGVVTLTPVFRLNAFRRLQPPLYSVPAVAGLLRYFGQRDAVPVKQTPNSSQLFHGDHLLKSCSKYEQ